MRIRLYMDEDAMDGDLIEALRMRGVGVTSALETGTRGYSDEQQLEFANSQGRVLYSFNIRHYRPIHARLLESGQSHRGIILCEQRNYSIGEQMRRLLRVMAELSDEEMKDRVVFLSWYG